MNLTPVVNPNSHELLCRQLALLPATMAAGNVDVGNVARSRLVLYYKMR
jgi:hypothetical protein